MYTTMKSYGDVSPQQLNVCRTVSTICGDCSFEEIQSEAKRVKKGFSLVFSDYLYNRLINLGYKPNVFLFDHNGYDNGQYRYDFLTEDKIAIQLSFGNRTVTTRQLFMPTIANANRSIKSVRSEGLVVVTFTTDIKERRVVDHSIGTFHEYCNMCDLGEALFHSPVSVIGIGS
jgi:hypothetical protein